MADLTIIIQCYGENSWKAYFSSDTSTWGVGRSKSEAVASLYTNNIGKLILENPKRFGLRIEEPDTATPDNNQIVVRGRKNKRTKRIDIPLAQEDWNKILSALRNEFHIKVAELFRSNGNKPLSPKEINEKAGGFMSRFSPGVPESINGIMRTNRLKYRLLSAAERHRRLWDDDPLRFWIME
jgi:hypothetical protein